MEQEVQAISRKTLSVNVTRPQTEPRPKLLFTRTPAGVLVPPKKKSTSKSLSKTKTVAPLANVTSSSPAQGPPGPPGPPPPLSSIPFSTNLDPFQPDSEFSFEDLRRIEFIQEHANEALLVNTLNGSIISALAQHYTSIMESASCPHHIKTKCAIDFAKFVERISDISAEILIQKARVETLLRLLADRRDLVRIHKYEGIRSLTRNSFTLFWNIET